jgi:hypothetical protein
MNVFIKVPFDLLGDWDLRNEGFEFFLKNLGFRVLRYRGLNKLRFEVSTKRGFRFSKYFSLKVSRWWGC